MSAEICVSSLFSFISYFIRSGQSYKQLKLIFSLFPCFTKRSANQLTENEKKLCKANIPRKSRLLFVLFFVFWYNLLKQTWKNVNEVICIQNISASYCTHHMFSPHDDNVYEFLMPTMKKHFLLLSDLPKKILLFIWGKKEEKFSSVFELDHFKLNSIFEVCLKENLFLNELWSFVKGGIYKRAMQSPASVALWLFFFYFPQFHPKRPKFRYLLLKGTQCGSLLKQLLNITVQSICFSLWNDPNIILI